MEVNSSAIRKGITGYWRRKGYERLNGGGRKRKLRVVRLNPGGGGGSARRRRSWRVNLSRRLKLKLRFSPKKFLLGLRDAYVNMMMRLANSVAIGGGVGYGGGGGGGASAFGLRPAKEYDERVIVEIYKSIVMAQGQLAPRDAAWIGSELVACRR